MSENKEHLGIYMPGNLKQRLQAAAESERRSMSSMAIVLLEQALDQRESQHTE